MKNNKLEANSKNIFYGFFASAFLWLCIWATYNTDISLFSNPGFPHNALDLMHGLRSLLPFLALIISIIILFKKRSLSKKIFSTPLGLLGIFTIVGIFSSVFSKNPLGALYWGLLYGSVIIVLLTILENKDFLKKFIIINLIIAGILALGLALFFLIQPGAVKSLTFNFLICSQRPYEGLGNIGAAINTFGMPGTRPTGLGRYAGFVAVAALAGFLCAKNKTNTPRGTRKKIIWFFTLILFTLILFFSKGKTEILAFIIAMIFAIWLARKINIFSALGVCFVSLLFILIIFYNIPCSNSLNSLAYFTPHISLGSPSISKNPALEKPISAPEPKNIKVIVTLSGRTNGVWADVWHLFLKNPLLGFGFQADRFSLNGQHAHNSLIQALIQAGQIILFLVLLVLPYYSLTKLILHSRHSNVEQGTPRS